MQFSVIIPAFCEAHKIAMDVEAASSFLSARFDQSEIIIVDDGSNDGTSRNADISVPDNVTLGTIRYQENRGKGYAVRTGILASTGEYVMFADAGVCVPYEQSLRGLKLLQNDECDLAHGSRKLPESEIIRPHLKQRQLSSKLFPLFLRLWMHIPRRITDTQCGFKMYKGDVARELYGLSVIDGFMFDIEIICMALKRGYRIREFPISWTADPDTRLSLIHVPKQVLKETWRIKRSVRQCARQTGE